MATDLPDRLDLAWELRLVSYTYREEFGCAPTGVWHAPGTITLLADGPAQLTVPARWGAIVAAGPRSDGIIEPIRMNRPDERLRLTVEEAAGGSGPAWAGPGLRSVRDGASLLINTDLPEGSGVGAALATQAAIGLALRGLTEPGLAEPGLAGGGTAGGGLTGGGLTEPGDLGAGDAGAVEPEGTASGEAAGMARLGDRRLPFGLAAAGLRLMVIDTRVRGFPQPAIVEHAPVEAAAAALEAGAFGELGPMLTAAHAAQACDNVQELAVSAALGAGALGARMIVDGPGRPVCALVPAHRLVDVRIGVAEAFAGRHLLTPRFLTVSAAQGPRRAA
jgi:galactokinase